jgi:hypothetical protein
MSRKRKNHRVTHQARSQRSKLEKSYQMLAAVVVAWHWKEPGAEKHLHELAEQLLESATYRGPQPWD